MPTRLRLCLALASSALLVSSVATTATAETATSPTYASVQGTVVDETGSPVAGAQLVLQHGDSRYATSTDADGTYGLAGLASGSWVADFSADYVPDPRTLTLTAGTTTAAQPLVARPGATVSGRIVVAGGLPDGAVAYASLTVPGSQVERSASAAADGTWTTTGIPAGRTTVTLTAGGSETVTRTLDVAAGAATASTGTVTLRRAYDISGQVQLPEPIGPHDSLSSWRADLHAATSSGSPTGPTLRWVPMRLGAGDQWASYSLDGIVAGRYVVRVVETYQGTSRAALQKTVTVTNRDLDLGAPMISVGAPISGTAYDGSLTVLDEGEVTAFDVPCTGATPVLTYGVWGAVHRDGTFSVPTQRGHCYALTTAAPGYYFKGSEAVGDLLHVRAGTAHVKAHPRLWARVSGTSARLPYGQRSLIVHVTPYGRATSPDGGSITLRTGGRTIGSARVTHGRAVVRLSAPLLPGTRTISATWGGTTSYAPVNTSFTVRIAPVATHGTVSVGRATSAGATVTVRATTALRPAGPLILDVDYTRTARATAHLEGGVWVATVRMQHVPTGRHSVLLVRSGNGQVLSTSTVHRVTVSATRSGHWTFWR
ncbi:carboxypeptidase-like regulatory domain-containing protein [Luteimicrobium subarcticum]|uniref:Ig-like domain-containing protein n=1 Tax=Luteimicrobium subarcticum TaxID=620910 RepID=A0A2M8W6I9_9MICO|nr:carboxypeptidase-like regulatory domain-containing protein [Luteimicrobium subarcticum]PJI86548.1 Ig-like domain-containing protein [Luteimicrobium subarcticum]